jgi:phosphoglycolate phosphatase
MRPPPHACAVAASLVLPADTQPGARWYFHQVCGHLVLWDIDNTLIDAGGLSHHLYGAVFAGLFGRELPEVAPMAGRTDRAIILETLARSGIDEPARHVEAFVAGLTARAPEFGDRVRSRGRALPGAVEALTALAALAALATAGAAGAAGAALAALATPGAAVAPGAEPDGRLVQSVLTGNIRPLAEVKLGALGLSRYLDLDSGAYGDAHEVRAELVHLARRAAGRAYGTDFGGRATVLVGDTPLDVQAALATGARAVAVATGQFSAAELAAAGPDELLPDLTDTARVVAAILA